MSKKRGPVTAKPLIKAVSAWFYENDKSIDVYIEAYSVIQGNQAVACRIKRTDIEDWLKRTI